MYGFAVTRSPGSKPSTSSPASRTSPQTSMPRIAGRSTWYAGCGWPLRIQMSRWLTDVARRRTRRSPGPGEGSGTSSTRRTSGPPCSWILTARTSVDRDRALDLDQELGKREPRDADDRLRRMPVRALHGLDRARDRLELGGLLRVDRAADDVVERRADRGERGADVLHRRRRMGREAVTD